MLCATRCFGHGVVAVSAARRSLPFAEPRAFRSACSAPRAPALSRKDRSQRLALAAIRRVARDLARAPERPDRLGLIGCRIRLSSALPFFLRYLLALPPFWLCEAWCEERGARLSELLCEKLGGGMYACFSRQ